MKILFFDGYCSVCNRLVDWGLQHDKSQTIQYASLQGEAACSYLKKTKFVSQVDTVVYLRDGTIYDRSDAVLFFLQDLRGPWSVISIFRCFPRAVRDWIYSIFAKNRYRFFKKRESCRVPTVEEKNRLLA